MRWQKDWVVLLIKIICFARTEYYKRFNGSVSKVKRRGRRSFFEKKEQAKRKGEQASTKLLAPMMVMLVVILVLLMFPALSTFS